MSAIKIYNHLGQTVDVIYLPDKVNWLEGRLSSSSHGTYFKGAGCPYTGHNEVAFFNDSTFKEHTFYPYGVRLINPYLMGKSGIFLIRFVPVLDEYIGGCGPRERNILDNSVDFELSDVEVLGKTDISGTDHSIYEVRYKNKRIKFIEAPDLNNFLNLVDFMLDNDWNQPWDKDSISDVSKAGTITDVADLFRSDALIHKVGTVVSLVASLFRYNQQIYRELRKKVGVNFLYTDCGVLSYFINYTSDDCILTATTILMKKIGVIFEPPFSENCFMDFVLSYLIPGRNCGYAQFSDRGEVIKKTYEDRMLFFRRRREYN